LKFAPEQAPEQQSALAQQSSPRPASAQQARSMQRSGATHVAQAPPLPPQASSAVPGWQTPPLQQPSGQPAAVQAHAPATQSWPARQHAPLQ
jgi:hypothetical protein